MARIADTRSAMHIHTNIARRRDQRFACMQAHPHAQMFALWPRVGGEGALRVGGTLHCIQSPAERNKERVPLRIYFTPVPFLNRGTENFMMLCQYGCVLIA